MSEIKYFETQVLSLDKEPFCKKTLMLTVKATGRSFAVLAGHAPLLAYLEPLTALELQTDQKTEEITLPCGGILEVKNNLAKIFVSELK